VREPDWLPNPLSPALKKLSQMVRDAGRGIPDDQKQDFSAAADRLAILADTIETWRMQKASDSVYWAELARSRRGRTRISLASSPLDVGATLRAELFNEVPSVILTSATLSVAGKSPFEFIQSRLGVTQAATHQFGSPFNYQEQAELILLRDMPEPSEKLAYEAATVAMIKRYVERTDGHAFALFTSYDMLSRCAQQLQSWLAERRLALYSQADGVPRSTMIAQFKANPRGLLLGTDSFWQGVDVPGEALSNVIITKLPFSVPDQPLFEARLEAIRQRGGNPFVEYQVPEAVLKLKQGFGRLIRTARDKGIVVILDPRISTKPYGKQFLQSLPKCKVTVEGFPAREANA
jgi:ATP-dependent DNA helicase DinG